MLLCTFLLTSCGHRASTGYIAIHDDSVEGPLLGYLSNHKVVPSIEEAVEYTYTTNGFMAEIMVAVSLLLPYQLVHKFMLSGLRIQQT